MKNLFKRSHEQPAEPMPDSIVVEVDAEDLIGQPPKNLPLPNIFIMRHAKLFSQASPEELAEMLSLADPSVDLLAARLAQLMPQNPRVEVFSTFTERTTQTALHTKKRLGAVGIEAEIMSRWRRGYAEDMHIDQGLHGAIRNSTLSLNSSTLVVGHDSTPDGFGVDIWLEKYAQIIERRDGQVNDIAPGYEV